MMNNVKLLLVHLYTFALSHNLTFATYINLEIFFYNNGDTLSLSSSPSLPYFFEPPTFV